MLLEQLNRFRAAASFNDCAIQTSECAMDETANYRLVIDEQHKSAVVAHETSSTQLQGLGAKEC
jgi:hypothetical protein